MPRLPIISSSNRMNAGCTVSSASVSQSSVSVMCQVPLNAVGVSRVGDLMTFRPTTCRRPSPRGRTVRPGCRHERRQIVGVRPAHEPARQHHRHLDLGVAVRLNLDVDRAERHVDPSALAGRDREIREVELLANSRSDERAPLETSEPRIELLALEVSHST